VSEDCMLLNRSECNEGWADVYKATAYDAHCTTLDSSGGCPILHCRSKHIASLSGGFGGGKSKSSNKSEQGSARHGSLCSWRQPLCQLTHTPLLSSTIRPRNTARREAIEGTRCSARSLGQQPSPCSGPGVQKQRAMGLVDQIKPGFGREGR
jgi:hypothetical protein